jgi:ketosteroid isomerase-like protein
MSPRGSASPQNPLVEKTEPEPTMTQQNLEIVTRALRAVEQRDAQTLRTLYHPQIEFHWPPGLPYSGAWAGAEVIEMQRRFREVWHPLQPTEESRRMDFQVVAVGDDGCVIVKYRLKGVDSQGHRFETLTLADYQVRDGLFARAQMYYYDLQGLIAFLDQAAAARVGQAKPSGDGSGPGLSMPQPGPRSA